MKSDKILDAMNLIDDQWIEPVEHLRNESTFRRIVKRLPWEYMKVAACIGVFLLGIYVLDHAWVLKYWTFKENMQSESVSEEAYEGTYEEQYELSESMDDVDSDVDSVVVDDSTEEVQSDSMQTGTVAVVIKEWREDGFVGTVTDFMDLKSEDVGKEISVYVDVHIDTYTKVEVKTGEETYYTQGMPDPQYLPAGTEVYVHYNNWTVYHKMENGIRIEEISVQADIIKQADM